MQTLNQRGIKKPPLDLKAQKEEHQDITEDSFWSIVPLVWDYTELPVPVLYNLYCSALYTVNSGIDGDFVECGVHMGGSVMMIRFSQARQFVREENLRFGHVLWFRAEE